MWVKKSLEFREKIHTDGILFVCDKSNAKILSIHLRSILARKIHFDLNKKGLKYEAKYIEHDFSKKKREKKNR